MELEEQGAGTPNNFESNKEHTFEAKEPHTLAEAPRKSAGEDSQ